jgi:hypothetical protein
MKTPSKKPEDIARALALLQARIRRGEEFPDATFAVASSEFIDYESLADAYDEADRQRQARMAMPPVVREIRPPAIRSIRVTFNWKRYRVDLDGKTGEPIGYAVEVSARGKSTTDRILWRGREGRDGMPQRLKDVLNVRGVQESIAFAMGWTEELGEPAGPAVEQR